MAIKRALHAHLAAALLTGVAGLHFHLVHTHDLTPWKGGGFGMFSTVDAGGARWMAVDLTIDGETFTIRPPKISDLEPLAKRLPAPWILEQYAKRLASGVWYEMEGEGSLDAKHSQDAAFAAASPPSELDMEAPYSDLARALQAAQAKARVIGYWKMGEPIPTRVRVVEKVTIRLHRPVHNADASTFELQEIARCSAPGLPLEEAARILNVPAEVLR